MISKQKTVIFLTVLIDAVGMGIIIPVLPFYVESFGATAFGVTALLAVFSLCSFFSAPFLGALSDKYGRRPILIISILSTSLGWFVFASAGSLIFLFVARIIDGMASGNFSTAQSYLIDISKNKKERTQNLGLISAAFGVGFILGPMLGGFLSPVSPSFPFWFVAFLALFNGVLAIFLVPETNFRASQKKQQEKMEWNPFLPLSRAFHNKSLHSLLLIWFLFTLAAVGMQSIIALYVGHVFGFGAVIVGVFMTFVGIVILLNQFAFLKHFWLKYFSENDLEFWLLLVFGIGFLLMAVKSLFWFIVGVVVMTFAQAVLRAVLTSHISGKGDSKQQGELMGVSSSLGAVASILGPLAAGAIFNLKASAPLYLSAAFGFLAFLIFLIPKKNKYEYTK
ncbi:MAG: MFS transporter [Candidatus Pacebacteria bacterium]|nr:MFS transporter [Candidatus Paceibacterota bacterium]